MLKLRINIRLKRSLSPPSSACFSHSTNGFSCSRRTPLPLPSLYHFRIASSLSTSAGQQTTTAADISEKYIKAAVWFDWIGLNSVLHPRQHSIGYMGLDWIVQCLTSPPTQYRLYGRRFLQVKRPNQQYLKKKASYKEKTRKRKQEIHIYIHNTQQRIHI